MIKYIGFIVCIALSLLFTYANASELYGQDKTKTIEVIKLDFESGSTTIQEIEFSENEGTILTVQPDGSITVENFEVNYESR